MRARWRAWARVGEPLFENSGFENGDFRNWTAEGDAFKFQSVESDKLRLQGEFCFATDAKNTGGQAGRGTRGDRRQETKG